MGKRNILFLFFTSITLFLFIGTISVEAKGTGVETRWIRIGAETIERGYPFALENDITLYIRPNIFSEPAKIKLQKYPFDEKISFLPEAYTKASSVFTYTVMSSKGFLLNDYLIVDVIPEDFQVYGKKVFVLDRAREAILPVPTTIYGNSLRVKLPFTFAEFVVLDMTTYAEGGGNSQYSEKLDSFQTSIRASAAIVYDEKRKKILFGKNENMKLPIASLTKLVTAAVFLEREPSLEKVVMYKNEDNAVGSRLIIDNGETIKYRDLFNTMLVGSANNATKSLVRNINGGEKKKFIRRMNEYVKNLGLKNTKFQEETGLDPNNVSTAYEVARFASEVMNNPIVRDTLGKQEHFFYTVNKNRPHRIKTTNKLLGKYPMDGGKTGYLDEARYTYVARVRRENGDKVMIVLLGNYPDSQRWQEAEKLIRMVR